MKEGMKLFAYAAVITVLLMFGAQSVANDAERREQCIAFADFAETREHTVVAITMIGGEKLGHEFVSEQIIGVERASRQCRYFHRTFERIQHALARLREIQGLLAIKIYQQA